MCASMQILQYWDAIGSPAILIHHLIFPVSYGIGLYVLRPKFGMFVMLVLQVQSL